MLALRLPKQPRSLVCASVAQCQPRWFHDFAPSGVPRRIRRGLAFVPFSLEGEGGPGLDPGPDEGVFSTSESHPHRTVARCFGLDVALSLKGEADRLCWRALLFALRLPSANRRRCSGRPSSRARSLGNHKASGRTLDTARPCATSWPSTANRIRRTVVAQHFPLSSGRCHLVPATLRTKKAGS